MKKATQHLAIVQKDPWLEPVEGELVARYNRYHAKLSAIEASSGSICDYANGYLYFGFHYDPTEKGWWFREWLPGAHEVYLFGDFNDWQRTQLPLKRGENGVWTIFLPDENYSSCLVHGSLVKLLVHGDNGSMERIPAYIRRVVQDEESKNFSGQLWVPPMPFDWGDDQFDIAEVGSLLIYESHVGMAQEKESVGTYKEFARTVLPHIKKAGYNAVQLMAIAEHPYYGSFGYHVSNFFAPSSRFGTPEELKALIKKAHSMGIAVIMDIVHSHYVKNLNEGLNELDGTDHHYSPAGEAGNQPYWDSKLFDYGKSEVSHFLLSNAKFWLDEYHFDGYRFDGVTSMVYTHHGYTEFDDRAKFFNDINNEALTYLTLANKLIHDFRPSAVTIAEDVSGMPGMCIPIEEGGVGFDYRLGMAIPDFWIKILKEKKDEEWNLWELWNIMTNRLPDVKTVTYCESHDQALVGDKTLAFRLMDQEMYTNMGRAIQSMVVDRGMALHKMIRLFTLSLGGQAYLNFMGNEFGHPEWIDFPRDGNGWSYMHARRQWSLADNGFLRYALLGEFDREMIRFAKKYELFKRGYAYCLHVDEANKSIVFTLGDLLFIFNWHPTASIFDYELPVNEPGKYKVVLSSDAERFGGYGRVDESIACFTYPKLCGDGVEHPYMKIYNVNRTALVFKRMK